MTIGESDGILIQVESDRSIGYATYFGAGNSESIEGISIDVRGNTYLICNGNFTDAFVSKISNDGRVIEYSTLPRKDSLLVTRVGEELRAFNFAPQPIILKSVEEA